MEGGQRRCTTDVSFHVTFPPGRCDGSASAIIYPYRRRRGGTRGRSNANCNKTALPSQTGPPFNIQRRWRGGTRPTPRRRRRRTTRAGRAGGRGRPRPGHAVGGRGGGRSDVHGQGYRRHGGGMYCRFMGGNIGLCFCFESLPVISSAPIYQQSQRIKKLKPHENIDGGGSFFS